MATYAIVENKLVKNVVLADDAFPLTLMFPKAQVIEQTKATGYASVGGDFIGGKFRPQSPFKSWRWDSELESWVAPVAMPADIPDSTFSMWSEADRAWQILPFEVAPQKASKE